MSTNGEVVPPGLADAQSVVTLGQRTDAIGLGLDLVLEHHGAPGSVRECLLKQLHSYLDDSKDETVWLKRAKHALAYPLSKYLKNPLPPAPDVVFKPSGVLRGWLKARFNAFNRKNTHFWYSWLQSKRSSLPASCDIIEATYEKHLETLTRKDPGDDATIEKILDLPIFNRLLSRIKKEVAERLEKMNPFEDFSASGSACFENSRSMSGQQGRLATLCGADVSSEPWATVWTSDLWSMTYSPKLYSSKGVKHNVVTEKRVTGGYEMWNSLRVHAEEQTFFSSFQSTNCTIQGILEPMKVRVISKGEALPYYVCKPIQVALHSSMRSLDPFRLIGRPFCPTDLMDLTEMSKPTDQWFSVDYSAATDGLSWKYSGAIFRKVIEDLPYGQRLIAESVLGPHKLHYPVQGRKGITFKGLQQNGQLMGSILSFPILCLANLGVYLLATNEVQSNWSDYARLRHVLINGDDMVYAADPTLWDSHVDIAAKVGLEMSVGKAYKHPVYANVNSTSVHYDLRKINTEHNCVTAEEYLLALEKPRNFETPWQIDFLNTGLFYGQHKVQDSTGNSKSFLRPMETEDQKAKWITPLVGEERFAKLLSTVGISTMDDVPNLTSSMNEVLRGSLPGKQGDILKKFLSLHKKEIQQECLGIRKSGSKLSLFTRNLFIPVALGGMGVDCPVDFKFEIKPVQLNIARRIKEDMELTGLKTCGQSPLPGYSVNDMETRQSVPWVRNVADQQIFGSNSNHELKFSHRKLRSYIGISLWSENSQTYVTKQ